MKDTLWNLAWALPLVLLTALGAALVLRRALSRQGFDLPRERTRLCETLEVSNATRLYVIEVDRQTYLLVESDLRTSLHATVAALPAPTTLSARASPPWLTRLLRGAPR